MPQQLFAAYYRHFAICNDAGVALESIVTGADTVQLHMYECVTVLQKFIHTLSLTRSKLLYSFSL